MIPILAERNGAIYFCLSIELVRRKAGALFSYSDVHIVYYLPTISIFCLLYAGGAYTFALAETQITTDCDAMKIQSRPSSLSFPDSVPFLSLSFSHSNCLSNHLIFLSVCFISSRTLYPTHIQQIETFFTFLCRLFT